MKKILFTLLLFTGYLHAQTYPVNPTKFGKISLNTNGVSTSTSKINTQEADGQINYIDAANLPVPTTVTNALELKTTVSAGAVSGFELTNNGDGTVNIASGIAYLRSTNDPYATIIKYPISAVTNLALTDNANNYVLVDYNGGSPTITVTTNGSTINTQTNSIAYVVARVGNDLEYLNLVGQNVDPNAKIRIRFLNQEGIRRASGAILGFSNRNLTLTSSVLFSGLIKINAAAFNTASPDTFTLAYNNGSTWTRTTGQTQVNNTQYNVSGVLTTMPNNTFRTDYVYLLPNNPSKLYVITGTTTYGSLTLAKGAPRPSSLPVELQVLGLEVGRLFIEKNSAAVAEVQSSFANDFVGAAVPEHNSLSGLQGGAAGEYNHLTNAQIGLVNDINPASAQFNTLYHQTIATSSGTVSSVGTNWTGTTTSLTANMEGGYIEVSGVGIAIVASVNVGAQTFTTLEPLNSNVTNVPFEIHYKAYDAGEDGTIRQFRSSDGEQVAYIEASGNARYNGLRIDSNGNVVSEGFVFQHGDIQLRNNGEIISRLSTLTPYTVGTLPTPDSNKPAFAMVNDALNPIIGQTVLGGGSSTVPVYFDGGNWKSSSIYYTPANDSDVVKLTGDQTKSGILNMTDRLVFGTLKTSYGKAIGISKAINETNVHIIDDYSVINSPVSSANGFGVFDASTEMTGTASYDHFQAYQSRLNYSANGDMTGRYGLTGFFNFNSHTGSGVLQNNHGIFLEDIGGSGSVNNNTAIHIEPIVRGNNNWVINSLGGDSKFSGDIHNTNGKGYVSYSQGEKGEVDKKYSVFLNDGDTTLFSIGTGTYSPGNFIFKSWDGIGSIQNHLTIDIGSNTSIFTGNVSAANYSGDATLTGTPTAPTPTTGNGIANKDYVDSANGWVKSGNDIYNTNTDNVLIGTTSENPNNSRVVIKQRTGGNSLMSFLNSSGVASGEITISGTGTSLNLYSGNFSEYLTANGFNVNSSGQGFYSSDTGSYFAPISGGWSSLGKITYTNTESITNDGDLTPKLYVDKNTLKTYTFATLPASPVQGDSYAITDALTPTYLGEAVGGGSVYAPVVWNGTAWVFH